MRRANTSMTNTTYSQPCEVAIWVKSGTPRLVWPLDFGHLAGPSPLGNGAEASGSGIVVRTLLLPRVPMQPQAPRQALDRAMRDTDVLATHLLPDLGGAIHLPIGVPDTLDIVACLANTSISIRRIVCRRLNHHDQDLKPLLLELLRKAALSDIGPILVQIR